MDLKDVLSSLLSPCIIYVQNIMLTMNFTLENQVLVSLLIHSLAILANYLPSNILHSLGSGAQCISL
jgi:hypothetical protein